MLGQVLVEPFDVDPQLLSVRAEILVAVTQIELAKAKTEGETPLQ